MTPVLVEPLAAPPDAVVTVPGSKSITNRALVAAALADGTSRLSNVLVADDTEAMVAALRELGAVIDVSGDVAVVTGVGGRVRPGPRSLDVRQAGTVARFLPPVLAAAGSGRYSMDGHAAMRARPMAPVLDALRALGVAVEEQGPPGHLPFTFDVTDPAAKASLAVAGDVSSQHLSGLLLAGPLFAEGLEVRLTTPLVSRPYVDMTLAVLEAFGASGRWVGADSLVVDPGRYRPADVAVEPDASAASYFFAAAAVTGGRVTVPGLGRASVQGDLGFVDVLASMGAQVAVGEDSTTVEGSGVLHGVDVDLRELSDTAPTLAVVAACADSPTRVRGIGFIRGKETDRVGNVVAELRRLGILADEEPDGFVVHPGRPHAGEVRTYGDHRMAMSFAVLGLVVPGISIDDPSCVAKTFPGYWDALDRLRGR